MRLFKWIRKAWWRAKEEWRFQQIEDAEPREDW